jgi:hypothetical protein
VHRQIGTLTAIAALTVGSFSGIARSETSAATGAAADVLERFLGETPASPVSYRALRTLEATARGGGMTARLTAWTSRDPDAGFQYTIVDESGSGVIRSRVLRAALEAERTLAAGDGLSRGALTGDNYTFSIVGAGPDGLLRVGITPKRRDTLLVDGTILLTHDAADLVQVEGFLVKRPSFWTRRVEVVRRYARLGGVRVPTSLHSTAKVLIVGTSTFSMTYEYESINGAPVGR